MNEKLFLIFYHMIDLQIRYFINKYRRYRTFLIIRYQEST